VRRLDAFQPLRERQREVEQVVETDADGDGFEAEGFEGKFSGERIVHLMNGKF